MACKWLSITEKKRLAGIVKQEDFLQGINRRHVRSSLLFLFSCCSIFVKPCHPRQKTRSSLTLWVTILILGLQTHSQEGTCPFFAVLVSLLRENQRRKYNNVNQVWQSNPLTQHKSNLLLSLLSNLLVLPPLCFPLCMIHVTFTVELNKVCVTDFPSNKVKALQLNWRLPLNFLGSLEVPGVVKKIVLQPRKWFRRERDPPVQFQAVFSYEHDTQARTSSIDRETLADSGLALKERKGYLKLLHSTDNFCHFCMCCIPFDSVYPWIINEVERVYMKQRDRKQYQDTKGDAGRSTMSVTLSTKRVISRVISTGN